MTSLLVLLLLWAFPLSNAKGRLREFQLIKESLTRDAAVNACRTNYTDLATVYDQQDNIELKTLLIHINNESNPSGWIGAEMGNSSKKWSNGDEVTYTELNTTCGGTYCTVMKFDSQWDFLQCTERKYFMCYEQDVGRASYMLISEKKTWFEAQLYCREKHTDLVSISNEEENKQVWNEGKESNDPFWIGLLEDSVEWSDGGQSAYRNFVGKQSGDYTFMNQDGSWSKSNEDIVQHAFCYKSFIHVSSYQMSWEEALDYCSSNFNGLLRIESEDDQVETEREIKRKKVLGPVWVGLRQSRLFGFWIWYNGVSVGNWTNWKEGSPPEHQVSQHCGALEKVKGQYKWCDKDCRSKFRVLCEEK